MRKELSKEQAEAIRRKQSVLDRGLYTPIPHALYRDRLPAMNERYNKQDVRDALFIYGLLCAYVNGQSDKDVYLWAFLTVDQIADMSGIDRNRIKRLSDILEDEALIYTEMKRVANGRKKFYMPLL